MPAGPYSASRDYLERKRKIQEKIQNGTATPCEVRGEAFDKAMNIIARSLLIGLVIIMILGLIALFPTIIWIKIGTLWGILSSVLFVLPCVAVLIYVLVYMRNYKKRKIEIAEHKEEAAERQKNKFKTLDIS